MKQEYQQPDVKFVLLQDDVVRTSGVGGGTTSSQKGDADVTAWPDSWVD